ncbi:hypothetical protein BCR39DRAFT_506418 [Naematelia encephala]|uniref:Uncharacterized protein n=1 Tax=Naematelia encephala TaxID=71784 RepID=A0A1Y2AXE4_9TREE|nr:hypothetical protein BCR39DRAFT_506418 [Naematelia encephala]
MRGPHVKVLGKTYGCFFFEPRTSSQYDQSLSKMKLTPGYWTLVQGGERIRMEVPGATTHDDVLEAQSAHFASRNVTASSLQKRFEVYSYSTGVNSVGQTVSTLSIGNVAGAIGVAAFVGALGYFFYSTSKGSGSTSVDVGGTAGSRRWQSRITAASAVRRRRQLSGGLTMTTSCDSGDCADSEEYSQDDDNDLATQIYNLAVDDESGDGSGEDPSDYSNVYFGITWVDDVGSVQETCEVQAYSD